ncbi:restriction endonuclease [Brevundimonas sp. GCM10030266]|uniref:restriction endonuclease n=1 Tax=Brevundimonas sp. GCM10030266 TaxID=3273386 RepID=UPI0036240F01
MTEPASDEDTHAMLIPTSEIRNWKDLQDRVANLFRDMGYEVSSPLTVELVRGKKEVDVHVVDPRTSVPHVIIIECKHWKSRVPQETVHSMQTVMEGCGANTGIIVSSKGFQKGAPEAAAKSNIQLMTWEALQKAYGHEWFLRQREKLAPLQKALLQTDGLYLDQWETPKTIFNWMQFNRMGTAKALFDLLAEGRQVTLEIMGGPKSYDEPGPFYVSPPEGNPDAVRDSFGRPSRELGDVRAWFAWINSSAQAVIDRTEDLLRSTSDAFDALPGADQDAAFKSALAQMRTEMPVRLLEEHLEPEEYQRMLGLLENRKQAG